MQCPAGLSQSSPAVLWPAASACLPSQAAATDRATMGLFLLVDCFVSEADIRAASTLPRSRFILKGFHQHSDRWNPAWPNTLHHAARQLNGNMCPATAGPDLSAKALPVALPEAPGQSGLKWEAGVELCVSPCQCGNAAGLRMGNAGVSGLGQRKCHHLWSNTRHWALFDFVAVNARAASCLILETLRRGSSPKKRE